MDQYNPHEPLVCDVTNIKKCLILFLVLLFCYGFYAQGFVLFLGYGNPMMEEAVITKGVHCHHSSYYQRPWVREPKFLVMSNIAKLFCTTTTMFITMSNMWKESA